MKDATILSVKEQERARNPKSPTLKLGTVSKSNAHLIIPHITRSFESAKIPHTAIKRYPVVARWRADVDYVAAGIFCFQVSIPQPLHSQFSSLTA